MARATPRAHLPQCTRRTRPVKELARQATRPRTERRPPYAEAQDPQAGHRLSHRREITIGDTGKHVDLVVRRLHRLGGQLSLRSSTRAGAIAASSVTPRAPTVSVNLISSRAARWAAARARSSAESRSIGSPGPSRATSADGHVLSLEGDLPHIQPASDVGTGQIRTQRRASTMAARVTATGMESHRRRGCSASSVRRYGSVIRDT